MVLYPLGQLTGKDTRGWTINSIPRGIGDDRDQTDEATAQRNPNINAETDSIFSHGTTRMIIYD